MVASAGEALWQGQALGAQVLLVDPPRRGLDEDVLQKLCKPYNPNQPYVEQAEYLIGNSDNREDVSFDVYLPMSLSLSLSLTCPGKQVG